MGSVVLEPIEVLVALPTVLAAIWLFLLHAQSTGIRRRCFGIDNRECAVGVVVKGLVSMAVLFFVSDMRRIIEHIYSQIYGISSHFDSCMPFHILLLDT